MPALKGYRSLSRRISKLKPDQSSQASMAVAIDRSWCGDRRFYSNLISNIKSHKPDGEVGIRHIHASSMNKREGLSRWVSRELQGPLTGHTWFLTSSSQLVADIRTVVAEDCDYFVKLDVRDFYMIGTPSEPKDSINILFPPGPRCRLLCEAVEYLLSSEYVVSNLVPGRVFSAWAIAVPGALLTVRFSRWEKENLLQDHTGAPEFSESSDTIAAEMMF